MRFRPAHPSVWLRRSSAHGHSGGARPTAEPAPDVVIVGGGVIGCAIAYHLSLAGVGVLLLERERLAAGAPRVAAGMLAPPAEAPHDDAFFALAPRWRAPHPPLATAPPDGLRVDVEVPMTGIFRDPAHQ